MAASPRTRSPRAPGTKTSLVRALESEMFSSWDFRLLSPGPWVGLRVRKQGARHLAVPLQQRGHSQGPLPGDPFPRKGSGSDGSERGSGASRPRGQSAAETKLRTAGGARSTRSARVREPRAAGESRAPGCGTWLGTCAASRGAPAQCGRAALGLPTPLLPCSAFAGERREACGGREGTPTTGPPLPAAGAREDSCPPGEAFCTQPGVGRVPALSGANSRLRSRAPRLLPARSGVRSCPRFSHTRPSLASARWDAPGVG